MLAGPGQPRPTSPEMPGFILELGANLLSSCPAGGVLLLGSDLEALSVWYDDLDLRTREILPIRPDRYATDSIYRRRMAEAMGIDPGLPVRNALEDVADHRHSVPHADGRQRRGPAHWTGNRSASLGSAESAAPGPEALSVTELLEATRQGSSVWVQRCPGGVRPRRAVQ